MSQSQTLNRQQRRALEKKTKQQAKTQMAWMASKDLKPGDKIVTKDGRIGTVKAVNAAPGLHTVLNFAVEDHHTYFVGNGPGVWVHNLYKPTTKEEAENFIGPLEAADAHLRDRIVRDPRENLNDLGLALFNKGGQILLSQVGTELAELGIGSNTTQTQSNSLVAQLDKDGLRGAFQALGLSKDTSKLLTGKSLKNNGYSTARNLLSSHSGVAAVEQKVANAINPDETTLANISLTQSEYILATNLGIWSTLKGNNNLMGGVTSNKQVARLSSKVAASPEKYTDDRNNAIDVREFALAIGQITNEAELGIGSSGRFSQAHEKFVVFERANTGEVVVTRLAALAEQGAVITRHIDQNTISTLHDHHTVKFKDGTTLTQTPTPRGDSSLLKLRNIPSFMFASEGNTLYEIYRSSGNYEYAKVKPDYSLGKGKVF